MAVARAEKRARGECRDRTRGASQLLNNCAGPGKVLGALGPPSHSVSQSSESVGSRCFISLDRRAR